MDIAWAFQPLSVIVLAFTKVARFRLMVNIRNIFHD